MMWLEWFRTPSQTNSFYVQCSCPEPIVLYEYLPSITVHSVAAWKACRFLSRPVTDTLIWALVHWSGVVKHEKTFRDAIPKPLITVSQFRSATFISFQQRRNRLTSGDRSFASGIYPRCTTYFAFLSEFYDISSPSVPQFLAPGIFRRLKDLFCVISFRPRTQPVTFVSSRRKSL